ncbi:M16 family metallopeptidase [Lyngbya confervoides]|uniref:Insulinase family protein n=1 Tax=Lyngbya confervoides BDU141951 TaxID=1574623 RepID=A0ABD4T024_9CYAN|nr:pitrilysin family protein [Lyngbya confervoides]MCM1981884.1 insulinase family protein [Lyngbya confervoides BDU141951]
MPLNRPLRSLHSQSTLSRQRRLVQGITLVICFLIIPGLLLLITWMTPALAATPRHYNELTFPPLPEVQVPDYQRTTLDNGLTLYLLEDHDLPLVSGQAWIKTGSRWEPADQVGLASITGEVMRSGGTLTHPADQLNELLEQRAAAVEVSIDTTAGSASFSALSEDLPQVFELFSEVLRKPALPPDKIDLSKTQHLGSIQRRNDDPEDIGSREFRRLIYGRQSPYARIEEVETIDNIQREDIQRFYQTYFQPNRMILGIVGDFDTPTLLAQINQTLGDWRPSASGVEDTLPEVAQTANPGLYLVNLPQLTQSTVQIGHLGGRLDEPDVFPLYVMNEILNSFGGRLFNEVRSRQGLAYSVYGVWSPQYDYPGLLISGGQTRSDTTVPFIQAVKSELKKLRETQVSAKELQQAKDAILNSFVFNFDRPGKVLTRLMRYEYYGYPEDFIFRYQRAVKATTQADVLGAAQRNLRPDQLVTLVVGNQASIQPPLTSLAPQVTPVDVTIPKGNLG